MNKKTIWLTNETRTGLKKLDNYLSKQPWKNKFDMNTIYEVRELITNIETKGYYNYKEQSILNTIRSAYIDDKKNVTD